VLFGTQDGPTIALSMSIHIAQGIAADASRGMNGKPRAWDRDEELDLVIELDKAAAAYRAQEVKKGTKNAGKANAAAGILNIWNSAGALIFNGAITRLGFPGKSMPHAEQSIVDWARNSIMTKTAQLQGATINLLIFSQTDVCLGCLGKATTGVWKDKLQKATGLPVGTVIISMSLWQWGNVNQSQYVPVFP